MTYLLDINLLLALADPMHVHHEPSHQWFAEWGQKAWATCPLTENGFARIASHPKYPNRPGDVPAAVLSILRQLCNTPGHRFWAEDLSILQILGWNNPSAYHRGMMGYKTPNIDRIANEGALFTDWYGQQSCTAGRAAFITGQSPFRTGLLKVGLPGAKEGISVKDPTRDQPL